MGKGNKGKRDKKHRKAGQLKRVPVSELVYRGNKYRTEELVPVLMQTEIGIYEIFVMADRKLTDHQVERAIARLILAMRRGTLPPLDAETQLSVEAGKEEELVTWNIRRNWQILFQKSPHPGRDNLVGLLRTILGSIDSWKSVSPTSRGYLKYLEGFLKKLGVSVDVVSPGGELVAEEPEHELFAIGRCWHGNGDPLAARAFRERVDDMIREGEGEQIVEICQELIAEFGGGAVSDELMRISIATQQEMLGGPSPSAFGLSRPPG